MTQMFVTKALTRYYSSWTLGIRGKNKANLFLSGTNKVTTVAI